MAAMLGDGMPLEQCMSTYFTMEIPTQRLTSAAAGFFEMPVVTRVWTTATVLTGLLVQCQILTPFQLFYSFRAVFHKQQVHTTTPCAAYTMAQRRGHTLTENATVLAPPLHLRLLRPPLPQPPLPHLLHPALRAHARGVRRLRRPLLLAHGLCRAQPARHRSGFQSSVSRHDAQLDVGVYMESTESRRAAELLGIVDVQGAVVAVGIDSV